MVILGDMFEVGETSSIEHKELIDYSSRLSFEKVIFIGKNFYEHKLRSNNILFFETTDMANSWFKNQIITDFEILMKGSRGMALEKLVK
jgi:UDP-N-acetylmuramoyl-tripeptide--D-alanyl-D-alanine ligase